MFEKKSEMAFIPKWVFFAVISAVAGKNTAISDIYICYKRILIKFSQKKPKNRSKHLDKVFQRYGTSKNLCKIFKKKS